MTQIEICCRITEMRDKGKNIVMLVPEKLIIPSPDEVKEKVEQNSTGTVITKVGSCYATSISRVTGDEVIDWFVDKVFEMAGITSAWGVFFC